MTRRPQDNLSQRELVDEVRLLLDGMCPTECGHIRCEDAQMRLLLLIAENPRSIWSTKVTYNIGRARAARLRTVHEARA